MVMGLKLLENAAWMFSTCKKITRDTAFTMRKISSIFMVPWRRSLESTSVNKANSCKLDLDTPDILNRTDENRGYCLGVFWDF
jgi:hypothetical protein